MRIDKPELLPDVARVLLGGPDAAPSHCDPAAAAQVQHLCRGGAPVFDAAWREYAAELVAFAEKHRIQRPRGGQFFAEAIATRRARGHLHPTTNWYLRTIGARRAEDESIAIHESGHAVVASRLNMPVAHVAICAAPATMRAKGFVITSTESLTPADADRLCASRPALMARWDDVRLADQIVVLLAGAAAEDRLGRRIPDGDWSDRRQVEHLIASVLRRPGWDGRVQTLAGAFSQRAAAAVERDWPWIQRVANALVRARTLTGGEVLRLRDAPDEETSRQSDDEPSAAARDNAHAFARAIVDASTPGGAGADLADVLAEATRQYFIARKEQRSMAGAEVQEL